MKIKTSRFGEIEVNQNSIIQFDEGMLGFPNDKKFILIDDPCIEPFMLLQSIEQPHVSFFIFSAAYLNDYQFTFPDREQEMLKAEKAEDLSVFLVTTFRKNPQKITINLQAPVLINSAEKKGLQFIIQDCDYEINYPLYKECE